MTQEIEQVNNTTNEAMEAVVNNYRCICTMDVSTFDGKRAIINARNTATSLASLGDKPLTVMGAYVAITGYGTLFIVGGVYAQSPQASRHSDGETQARETCDKHDTQEHYTAHARE